MSTTDIYGRLFDAGGMIHNVRHPDIGCEFNAGVAAPTDPLTDDAPSLQRYLNRTGVGAEASFPQGAGVFSNVQLPASTKLQGLGMHQSFLWGRAGSTGDMLREATSAVKVTLRDLTINAKGVEYGTILSLGNVNPTGAPWGTEAYLQNVWVRDADSVSPSTRADWGVRLLGNVAEVDGLKVYGGKRGLSIGGTAIRASKLTLATSPDRVLEVVGHSHSLSQVEIEGPGVPTAMTITVRVAGAVGDTVLKVNPLPLALPTGTQLVFGGTTVTLTDHASTGTNEVDVAALSAAIAAGATAQHTPEAPIYISAAQTSVDSLLFSCGPVAYRSLIYIAPVTTERIRIAGLQVLTRTGSDYEAVINHDGLLFGRRTFSGTTSLAHEPAPFTYDTSIQQPYYLNDRVATGNTDEVVSGTLTIRQVHPGMRIVVASDVSTAVSIHLNALPSKLAGKTYTVINNSTRTINFRISNGSVTIHTGGGATSTNFAIPAGGIFEVTPAQGSGTDVRAFYYAP